LPVRLLNLRLIRLAAACSLLAWLAACTTVPPSPARPAAGLLPVVTPAALAAPAAPAAAPASPEAAGTPADAAPAYLLWPSRDLPRAALLAGEAAREFQRGGASWYGPGFHGRRTASGERYDMNAMTAAHRTLPFGSMVRVHSLVNGRDVDVRITDRGPYSGKRIIDVSRAAAAELGMLGLGFKEVVLLVPESNAAVAVSPSLLPGSQARPRRSARRGPGPRAR
jgi:rare lipoprotein A